jgi:hypothetical protein
LLDGPAKRGVVPTPAGSRKRSRAAVEHGQAEAGQGLAVGGQDKLADGAGIVAVP